MSTSILSRRWRHVWEHLQVFNFYDGSVFKHKDDFPSKGDAYFTAFVNAVLALRRVRHIQKFRLSCKISDKDVITTWLRAAIWPHLQELHLDLSGSPSSINLYLPHSIVSCTTLVSLTLNGRIHVEKHSSIHLPSLKNLEMDTDYVDHMDKLLSGCSVLEALELIFYGERLPKIRMPSSLKSLTLKNCCHVIQDLEINTPFLEYLDIELVGSCLRFSVSNLAQCGGSNVDLISCITQHDRVFPKLLRALCRTKLLELRYSVLECLPLVLALDFPKFCCLLELDICIPSCNSRCLIDLLHKCHML